MSYTRKLIVELKNLTLTSNTKKWDEYYTFSAIFNVENYEEILGRTIKFLNESVKNGEVISCKIHEGIVIDVGMESLKVIDGHFFEIYDYEYLSVSFVRLYKFKQNERCWIAMYVDENLQTPWWNKKDRSIR